MFHVVRNGIGSTILPLISVQDEVARGVLAFRPISCPELRSICAIASRRGMAPSVVGEFAKIAQEAMTTLVERSVWPGVQVIKCARKSDASATKYLVALEPAAAAMRRSAIWQQRNQTNQGWVAPLAGIDKSSIPDTGVSSILLLFTEDIL
jgi:hypothetical protein